MTNNILKALTCLIGSNCLVSTPDVFTISKKGYNSYIDNFNDIKLLQQEVTNINSTLNVLSSNVDNNTTLLENLEGIEYLEIPEDGYDVSNLGTYVTQDDGSNLLVSIPNIVLLRNNKYDLGLAVYTRAETPSGFKPTLITLGLIQISNNKIKISNQSRFMLYRKVSNEWVEQGLWDAITLGSSDVMKNINVNGYRSYLDIETGQPVTNITDYGKPIGLKATGGNCGEIIVYESSYLPPAYRMCAVVKGCAEISVNGTITLKQQIPTTNTYVMDTSGSWSKV